MSEHDYRLESKEYTFTLFPKMLRVEYISETSRTERRDEYDLNHIIQVKSSYSSQDSRLLGAISAILGAISVIIGTQSPYSNIFQGFGFLLILVGVILLLLKSEQAKLSLILSNGDHNEYSMTVDNKSIYEFMNRLTINRNADMRVE